MNRLQTMVATLVLLIGVSIGISVVFKDPIPYAYNNLPNKLTQAMRQNGVHWAKVTVDGNEVLISGVAPNSSEMVLVKSLVQKEAGVNANFMGVEVKDIKTRNDFDSDEDWEEFREKNPPGSIYIDSSPYREATPNVADSTTSTVKTDTLSMSSESVDQNNNRLTEKDRYVLNFSTQSAGCETENRLDSENYEIIFKGSTAVIDARSLSSLDWIAELDESCPLNLKLLRKGNSDNKSLSERKIDEVRYHLMSSGIISERIVTEY